MNRLIYIFLLMIISVSAKAETFNVVSGTFEAIGLDGVSLDYTVLTGNGALTEGVYDGSAAGIATDPDATYAGFEETLFFGNTIYFYYAPSGVFDDIEAPLHNAPSINFGSMTADMTSMFANWNSDPSIGYIGEFNVGGIANVVALGANSWELSWSQIQADGPFLGVTTEMTMVISQVPVPSAAWLFGSGLIGLIGLAKRKL
jgi:hypothetical protein